MQVIPCRTTPFSESCAKLNQPSPGFPALHSAYKHESGIKLSASKRMSISAKNVKSVQSSLEVRTRRNVTPVLKTIAGTKTHKHTRSICTVVVFWLTQCFFIAMLAPCGPCASLFSKETQKNTTISSARQTPSRLLEIPLGGPQGQ